MSSRAWVTLATNDSYGLGALVLAHSLRRVGSAYPAVILITPSVTEAMRDRLRAVFAEVVTVDVLDSRDAAHLALLQRPELGITFTKIHCWNLTQYEKGVFLDADTLVIQNCDELFDREELSAAPDVGWPDCFNSGVFVFTPSADTFSRLITFAQERGSFDGGDQGLLNSFFSDWAHGDINKHLPFLYNVTSAAFYSYLPALKHFGQNLKIIHFIGAAKPWLQHFNFESRTVDAPEHLRGLLQLWWDLFASQVHPQLEISMVEVEEAQEASPTLPPHDVSEQYHYKLTLDPESEFPWHHPDAQISFEEQTRAPAVDMTQFHDPWDMYRGHIPPHRDDTTSPHSELRRVEDPAELRKYAWDYQAQQVSNVYEHQSAEHVCQSEQQQHKHQSYHDSNQHDHREHTHNENHSQTQHAEHHWRPDTQQEHRHEPQSYHEDQGHQNHQHHNLSQYPYQNHYQDQSQHYDKHEHDHQTHNNYSHSQSDYNSSHYQNLDPNIPVGDEAHKHVDYTQINAEPSHNIPQSFPQDKHKIIQQEVQVHHVHEEKEKKRKRRTRKLNRIDVVNKPVGMMNGDISETESDFDDIIPRHPYDGYYLRHRATIDSCGRKICSHEIPPTPSPSPPPESPSMMSSFNFTQEDEALPPNDYEVHSGVAGNLARVLPGAAGQNEALDELTRRQGWEAGNIDYMGADSFENIWAKISQTLSQPHTSPPKQSPPKEIPPPPALEQVEVQSGVVAQEPVVEPVEVAKEAVPVEVAPPVAPVIPVATPVAPEVSAPVEVPAPVAVPAPVDIPTTVEVAAAIKTTASVEPPVIAKSVVPTAKVVTVATPGVAPLAPVDVPLPVETAADEIPIEAPACALAEKATPAPAVLEAVAVVEQPEKKTETPAAIEKAASIPVAEKVVEIQKAVAPVEAPVETPKVVKPSVAAPAPAATAAAAAVASKPQATPAASDSPPLANTPSKEAVPAVPEAKSEERRKPAGKLKLAPPAAADPLPTPDSELEDAAALAQSIIASELRTPTVTAPSPTAASPLASPLAQQRLSVEEPEVPTPPVGAVSLAQIGVKSAKGKSTIADQIESSVSERAEPAPAASPEAPTPAAGAPKKKVVKKVVKKEAAAAAGGEASAPVPPPRKKEKKPKEK